MQGRVEDAGALRRFGRIGRNFLKAVGTELRGIVGRQRRKAIVARYLEQHTTRKLNIGCGRNVLPGWLNADFVPRDRDVIFLDAAEALPLPDASVHYVFSEHLIQDLTYPQQQRFLAEQARVLVPGGRIRVSGPDLMQVIQTFGAPAGSMPERYMKWAIRHHFPWADAELPSFAVNQLFEQCDGFLLDRETLRHALAVAGFVDIRPQQVGLSDDPVLRGLERHHLALGDEEINAFETTVYEATKA